MVTVTDQFRENRIVIRGHFRIGHNPTIDAASRTVRLSQDGDFTGCGQEAARRILGVEPAFNRVAALADVALGEHQGFTPRNAQLLVHEIDTGHHFRDRMLDLQAGVHLQKIKLPIRSEDKLDRPGTGIMHCAGQAQRRRRHLFAEVRGQGG